jgi:predicted MPP superfamily phosphohydrolase
LKQNATIVLHLGDVYYAGFPEEFKRISDKVNALQKIKPKFRYYTVPGNHDYYTFGGPFQKHLTMNNLDQKMIQKYSFFCLRNRSHTVQFLGIDTGINEHSFITALNPFHEGAVLETP